MNEILEKDFLTHKINNLEVIRSLFNEEGKNNKLLKKAVLIRGVEEAVVDLANKKIIRGPIHSYVGQEAVAVGVLSNSKKTDGVTSTHRGHGHYLARNCNLTKLIDELHGLKTGCNGGHGGSMHVAELKNNLYGANGIVGGGVPIACGLALANKLDMKDSVIFSFFGDGASNQGVVLESFNLAAFLSLPILFICENNQFAQSTRLQDVTLTSVAEKSRGFGIKSIEADGLNIQEIQQKSLDLIEFIRTERKPALLQANTYRFHRHFVAEKPKEIDYLNPELHNEFLEKDPIFTFAKKNSCNISNLNSAIEEIKNIIIEYSNSLKI